MTLKKIDETIQFTVDSVAFAIMRRFDCGKGPIRFGLYLCVVVCDLICSIMQHNPIYVLTAFIWLVLAESNRRADLAAGSARSRADLSLRRAGLVIPSTVEDGTNYAPIAGQTCSGLLLAATRHANRYLRHAHELSQQFEREFAEEIVVYFRNSGTVIPEVSTWTLSPEGEVWRIICKDRDLLVDYWRMNIDTGTLLDDLVPVK